MDTLVPMVVPVVEEESQQGVVSCMAPAFQVGPLDEEKERVGEPRPSMVVACMVVACMVPAPIHEGASGHTRLDIPLRNLQERNLQEVYLS